MSRLSTTVFASTWILGAALSVASPASAEECRKDLDCPGDTVCDAGRCVGADGPSPVSASVAPAAQTTTQQPAAPVAATPVAAAPVAAAPAQAPIAGAVPVRFTPRTPGEPLLVRDMATNASCTAPCTLSLPSGPRTMRIGGARSEDFDVPSEGGTFSVAEPTRGRRNGGVVLLSVGGSVALLSGLIVLAASAAASEDTPYGDTTTQTDDGSGTAKTVGTVGLVMGIGSVVAGVAMLLSSDMTPIRPAQDAGLEKQARKIKVRPTAGFDAKSGFLGMTGAF